jgi:hypothetical protein
LIFKDGVVERSVAKDKIGRFFVALKEWCDENPQRLIFQNGLC